MVVHSILLTVSVLSLPGHKEWRFLHPILPLMIALSAKYLVNSDKAKIFGRETLEKLNRILSAGRQKSSAP